MSAKLRKTPTAKIEVNGKKTPKIIENPDSYYDKKPVWVFSHCDSEHEKWGFHCCDSLFNTVIKKLISFESMTWGEIIVKDREKNHFIDMDKLCKNAQKRANELKLYVDNIFSLRFEGDLRVFGLIEDGVFQIIWYDPEHEICPCEKKRT